MNKLSSYISIFFCFISINLMAGEAVRLQYLPNTPVIQNTKQDSKGKVSCEGETEKISFTRTINTKITVEGDSDEPVIGTPIDFQLVLKKYTNTFKGTKEETKEIKKYLVNQPFEISYGVDQIFTYDTENEETLDILFDTDFDETLDFINGLVFLLADEELIEGETNEISIPLDEYDCFYLTYTVKKITKKEIIISMKINIDIDDNEDVDVKLFESTIEAKFNRNNALINEIKFSEQAKFYLYGVLFDFNHKQHTKSVLAK